jgi:Icc-related predicted phosphoesterase
MIRIITCSDTHDQHSLLKPVPDGDIFIHAGDFTNRGDFGELNRFREWMNSQRHDYKVVVAGNHDFTLDTNPGLTKCYMNGFQYLEDRYINIEGVSFYGSPWQSDLPGVGLYRSKSDAHPFHRIPKVDILVTHVPPRGILDCTVSGKRLGDEILLNKYTDESIAPSIHIFGHIHESRGVLEAYNTTFINTSSLDSMYKPSPFQYFVIDYDEVNKKIINLEEV